jgi:hypothetical protein
LKPAPSPRQAWQASAMPPMSSADSSVGARTMAGAAGTRQGIDRSDRPVFETGDPRYSWINKVQAAGKGVLSADKTRLDYEIYELR